MSTYFLRFKSDNKEAALSAAAKIKGDPMFTDVHLASMDSDTTPIDLGEELMELQARVKKVFKFANDCKSQEFDASMVLSEVCAILSDNSRGATAELFNGWGKT